MCAKPLASKLCFFLQNNFFPSFALDIQIANIFITPFRGFYHRFKQWLLYCVDTICILYNFSCKVDACICNWKMWLVFWKGDQTKNMSTYATHFHFKRSESINLYLLSFVIEISKTIVKISSGRGNARSLLLRSRSCTLLSIFFHRFSICSGIHTFVWDRCLDKVQFIHPSWCNPLYWSIFLCLLALFYANWDLVQTPFPYRCIDFVW